MSKTVSNLVWPDHFILLNVKNQQTIGNTYVLLAQCLDSDQHKSAMAKAC